MQRVTNMLSSFGHSMSLPLVTAWVLKGGWKTGGLPGSGDRYDCNHQPERMWSNTKTKLGCEAWVPNMARIPVMTLSLLSPLHKWGWIKPIDSIWGINIRRQTS